MLRQTLLSFLILSSVSSAQTGNPVTANKEAADEQLFAQFDAVNPYELAHYYGLLTNLKVVVASNIPTNGGISLKTKKISRTEMIRLLETTFLKHGIVITQIPDMKIVSVTFNDKLPAEPLLPEPPRQPPAPGGSVKRIRTVPNK